MKILKNNKNFIWNSIGTAFNSFLSLFLLIIVTRFNGIEIAGDFSFAFSVTMIFQTITNFCARTYQVSDLKKKYSFYEYLLTRFPTAVIAILLSIIVCVIYKLDVLSIVVLFTFLAIRIVESLSEVVYGKLQKEDNLQIVGKSMFYKSLIILLAFIIIEILFNSLILSCTVALVGVILLFLFYDLRFTKDEEKKYKKEKIIKLINENKYIFMGLFIAMIIQHVPRFVGKGFLNKFDFGYLSILLMIPTVMILLSQILLTPKYIEVVKAYDKKNVKEIKSVNLITVKQIVGLSIVCIIAAITIGPFALKILYNLDFDEYKLHFVILIVAGTFYGINIMYTNLLTTLRKTKSIVIISIISIIILVLLSIIMAYFYKMIGIMYAFMITMVIQMIISCVISNKYLKGVR